MTQDRSPKFKLPRKLEKILASLSVYYRQKDKAVLQRLLVNSRYHVHEELTYDGWDGGTYGHAVYFSVPAVIYGELLDNPNAIAEEIQRDINRISNVQNEHIAQVFLEIQDDPTLENWREKSGVFIHTGPAAVIASEEQLGKLWKPGYFRLFFSHKAEDKKQAALMKESLNAYGVACFVAHEDIEPTKEWQIEIEKTLFSMDALVALLTEGFSKSHWTDQEIGVAVGRHVPIVPVRLGIDPYGFIGKYQALAGSTKSAETLAKEVYDLLWTNPSLMGRLTDSLVARFEDADSFQRANDLMKYIKRINSAPPEIIERLAEAPKHNSQVNGAYEVRDSLPSVLKRLRGE